MARLRRQPGYQRATAVAAYLPFDGEPDITAILAADTGKQFFLPVVERPTGGRMHFSRYKSGERLRRNRFGICEPAGTRSGRISPRRIDLVLTPLVGFDGACHRLGMGSGYYDRCFSFLMGSSRNRPLLIGIAFECQRVRRIEPDDWDVPMNAVISEHGIYQRSPRA